jgi:hypothetical protein
MKSIALLSGSAVAGVCLGLAFEAGPVARPEGGAAPDAVSGAAIVETAPNAESVPVVLPGKSEFETFATLPVAQQGETVLKWVAKPAYARSCEDELAMVRALQALEYEQTAALLESVASAAGGKGDSLDFVRVALKERLAALDPKRALEFARQKNDGELRSAAVLAAVTKNAAEGLRSLAQLPEGERSGVWSLARGIDLPGGSLSDLAALIKETPELTKSQDLAMGLEGCVASLAARKMAGDPEGGLAEVRQIGADLRAARARFDPEGQTKSNEEPLPKHLTMGMLLELRELSPEAARKVFDSLSEPEKNRFLISTEAAARLKELGADAAIRFAETQPTEDSVKEAARGVWRGLAQQDRAAALQWLESLPPGSFRQGVLDAVKAEASMRSRFSGSASGALQAGTELLSRETMLDYYSAIASHNAKPSVDVMSPSEFIASLPLSDADKKELLRRAAPVQVK